VTRSSVTGLFTVRDGEISRVEYFFDHDRAQGRRAHMKERN
jgi:ketosteroid isomerase-like protein